MVDEVKLSAVLSEFARTLVTDFPIQGILDRLVARIVEIMPITGAGVTLITDHTTPRFVAASDPHALRFERLQGELGEGPCLLAYESGEAVAVPDLGADARFPVFGPAAVAAGLAAVFTFPLRHGDGRLGALDLYGDTPGLLDAHTMSAAQTLADVAAAYINNARGRDEARERSEIFHESSLHDGLTGLPNRVLLHQRLEHAAQRARRSQSWAAVLFADLDRFKQVNDLYGHQVGDELLQAVAGRLAALVRPGDTLARVSGDEFVFLCEDLGDDVDAEQLATRIVTAFDRPFALEGLTLTMTASVGIAFAGPGQQISQQLVVDADRAMYQAKGMGGDRHEIFDLRAAVGQNDRDTLERDLLAALADGDLDVVYQPVVRCGDGQMTGVEALLRWRHPVLGAVPPLTIVGIAEQSGLIDKIGAWVMDLAFADHRRWSAEHPGAPLDVAVNVSARQLMSPQFVRGVRAALARHEIDPAGVVIELTETVLIEDPVRALSVLADLKTVGVRLALDDFGTGYSSLSYLRRLPIDIVKIDQAFVADLGRAPTAGAIMAAVTDLAHALDMTVIAEGVETLAQRTEVRVRGCEAAQGFYFARPMPSAAIDALLAAAGGAPRLPLAPAAPAVPPMVPRPLPPVGV